ncbi:hypothetical protein FJT64_001803 [Amphibalanus amphitrite]|uniref:Uncharacterized protein n=1 Tax=Amphibalanus amphitrite TaxID=1232801 RepID=A0A6A4WYC2_AMPAM|nr:hypothetical protein FJT64_001803 [Amphibalanus amphitrite]
MNFLREEMKTLREEMTNHREETKGCKSEVTNLKTEMKRQKEENTALHSEVVRLQQAMVEERSTRQVVVEELRQEVRRLTAPFGRLQGLVPREQEGVETQVPVDRAQVRELEDRLNQALADQQRVEDDLKESRAINTATETRLRETEARNDDLISKTSDLEQTNASLKKRLHEMERTLRWGGVGHDTWRAAGIVLPIEPLLPARAPPWEVAACPHVTFSLDIVALRRDAPPDELHQAAQRHLASLPQQAIWVWTDGSADAGVCSGGAGAFVEWPDGATDELRVPAGQLCSSFRAEMVTLRAALNHLLDHPHQPSAPITICSDSQSALATLREGPASQKTLLGAAIWTELAALAGPSRRIHLQWVPSHCGVDGNERADQIAEAAALPQAAVPVDVPVDVPLDHERSSSKDKDEVIKRQLEEMQQQKEKQQALMNTKVALDAEISAFNKLLESKNTSIKKLCFPPGLSESCLTKILENSEGMEELLMTSPSDSTGQWARLLPSSLKKLDVFGPGETGEPVTVPKDRQLDHGLDVVIRRARDDVINQLAKELGPWVTALTMFNCLRVTAGALQRLLSALTGLEDVTLDGSLSGAITDASLAALHGCSQLRKMQLGKRTVLCTDIPVTARLVVTCRRLERLFLFTTDELSQTVLDALVRADLGKGDDGTPRTLRFQVLDELFAGLMESSPPPPPPPPLLASPLSPSASLPPLAASAPRRNSSLIWAHFVRWSDRAQCRYCGRMLQRGASGTTSSLWTHLSRIHGIERGGAPLAAHQLLS